MMILAVVVTPALMLLYSVVVVVVAVVIDVVHACMSVYISRDRESRNNWVVRTSAMKTSKIYRFPSITSRKC